MRILRSLVLGIPSYWRIRAKDRYFSTCIYLVLYFLLVYRMYIQKVSSRWVMYMNLHTAKNELRARAPMVQPAMLAVETLLVVSVSYMLVGIFA